MLAAALACGLLSASEAAVGAPAARPGDHPAVHVLPAPNVFPEGIATDGTDLYVGSNADGAVYRGRLDQRTTSLFLPPGGDGRT